MKSKTKFNAHQLRVGDWALIRLGSQPSIPARVISRGKTYLSPIGVRFNNDNVKYYDSKTTGFDEIVGGARLVDGKWVAL